MPMNRYTLGSIQEKDEEDDWVPKNKHDLLKAKYKCLKKLFQIYDSTMASPLPEAEGAVDSPRRRHKKRSHRSKIDAVVGTSETAITARACAADCAPPPPAQKSSLACAQHCCSCAGKLPCCSCVPCSLPALYRAEEGVRRSSSLGAASAGRRRRASRLKVFLVRLFGRQSRRDFAPSQSHDSCCPERRRRRGLRLRRVKLAHVQSEPGIAQSAVLSCVQAVQRSCLADTTRRQCPFVACHANFCGIINYNDHLNLCHFPERSFICHYCHEGYTSRNEKSLHEDQHLGILKADPDSDTKLCQCRPASPEDKRKKIVSFFDRKLDRPARESEMALCKGEDVQKLESKSHLTVKSSCSRRQLTRKPSAVENFDLVSKHGSIQVNCESGDMYTVSENLDFTPETERSGVKRFNYKWEPSQ